MSQIPIGWWKKRGLKKPNWPLYFYQKDIKMIHHPFFGGTVPRRKWDGGGAGGLPLSRWLRVMRGLDGNLAYHMYIPNLVMTNSSPWFFDGPFSSMVYLLNMVIFHGYVTNNQRVYLCIFWGWTSTTSYFHVQTRVHRCRLTTVALSEPQAEWSAPGWRRCHGWDHRFWSFPVWQFQYVYPLVM